MTRPLRAYLPAFLWAALLLALGGVPSLPPTGTDLPIDKLAHALLYGGLGAWLGWGWTRAGRRPAAAWLVACGILVGAADELHQRTVPGRSAELADFAADALGVLAGMSLAAGIAGRARAAARPGDARADANSGGGAVG